MLQIIFVLFLVFCTFANFSVQKIPLSPLESSNKMPFFSNFTLTPCRSRQMSTLCALVLILPVALVMA